MGDAIEAMEWDAVEDAVSGEWWVSGPDILVEDEQYAHLIAAAPEMYAACEAIINGWGHQDGVSKAVELARAALAKANGQQPT